MTTVVASFSTALHPCAIETLSIQEDDGDIETSLVVCGCYELDESSQHRNGSIIFYRCENMHGNVDDQQTSTINIKEHPAPITCPAGVLDLAVTRKYICAALASERLEMYSVNSVLEATNDDCKIDQAFGATKEGEGLFLSVDCFTANDSHKLAVSTQSSSIVVYNLTEYGLDEEVHISSAHVMFGENMPAWMVVWNPHNQHNLVSGGDDCAFRFWDTRCFTTPQITNKKHTAGVTSARFCERDSNLLLTGSYDESCMIWDVRALRNPLCTIETGGGVWRTKWCTPPNSKYDYLATANMQGGSNIYRLDLSSSDVIEVVDNSHFTDEKEKHLSYGIGVLDCSVGKEEAQFLTASCTFYDSTVYFWKSKLAFDRNCKSV